MDPVVHWFLVRVHTVLAFITDSLRKFFGMNSGDRITKDVPILRVNNVTPQEMLPRVRQVAQISLKRHCGSGQNRTVSFRRCLLSSDLSFCEASSRACFGPH